MFDVIPGQETEAELLRLEWREKKKEVNTSNEKENTAVIYSVIYSVNDKVEQDNSEYSENEKKTKESEVVDVED